jgi:alpha-beta hydrolase superfamily lysophospholipase
MANIILLHGAIGCSKQLQTIEQELSKQNHGVLNLNFPGHGSEDLCEEEFSIEFFEQHVNQFLMKIEGPVYIFGYSLGGYVAMRLALQHPKKIKGIMTFGTILNWTSEQADKQIAQINPEKLKAKVPAFVQYLEKLHGAKWESVLYNTHKLLRRLGDNALLNNDSFSQLEIPVILSVGDRDAIVSIDETLNAYRHLKQGTLIVYPDTAHPIEKADHKRIAEDFLKIIS